MNEIKKKFLNKTMVLGLSVAVLSTPFAVLSDSGIKAVAAARTAPTTGSIEYSLLDDDGRTSVTSSKVVFQNLSETKGGVIDHTTAWGYDAASGETNGGAALTKSSLKPGKYAITAQVSSTVTVTSFVDVKASDKATKVKAIALPTSANVDQKKSGKISGVVAANATVVVKNKTTAWTTKADTNGKFTLFVPAGSYDIIVDSDTNKKNTKYSIKVQAGQNNLPFDDLANDSVTNDMLEYEVGKDKESQPTINASSKEYKGKAVQNSTVRAYTVNDNKTPDNTTDDIYTLIGETVTKKAARGSTQGDFSIKLKEAQPGKKIQIVVEDEALNSSLPALINLPAINPDFKAMTNAVVGKDVAITFTDKSGALLNATDLKVTIKSDSQDSPIILEKVKKVGTVTTGDYTIASGKLTILNKTILKNITDFSKDTTFTIGVTASNFEDSNVKQIVKAVSAPSLTASVTKATAEGVKLTATATRNTTNKIHYKISSTSLDAPKLYSTVSDTTALPSQADNITGVDAVTNKYLAVYELDESNKVVKFKQLTLSSTNIKVVAPATVTKVTLEGSLGTAGDSKITDLASEKKYKVTQGTTVSYVKADGTLSTDVADVAALKATTITGLTNGKTYKVEEVSGVSTLTSSDDKVVIEENEVKVSESMTAGALKAVLSVDKGKGKYSIINQSYGEADDANPISEFMTIKTTAEDGISTTTYTITIQ